MSDPATHLHLVHELQWETEEDEEEKRYNAPGEDEIQEFYLAAEENKKSVDKRGHGDTLYLKVPPDVKSRAMIAVENKDTPYRSFNDFIRDALIHHLVRVDKLLNAGQVTPLVKVIQANARAETQRIDTEARIAMVQNFIASIENNIAAENWDGLRVAVQTAKESLDIAGVNVEPLRRAISNGSRQLGIEP